MDLKKIEPTMTRHFFTIKDSREKMCGHRLDQLTKKGKWPQVHISKQIS